MVPNPQTNPASVGDLLRTIGMFFAGSVALLIALFLDDYKRWRWKPKLDVFINTDPPCCVRMERMQILEGSLERPHYVLRLRITNNGNAQATDVEVYAKSLERKNGTWEIRARPQLRWHISRFTRHPESQDAEVS